MEEEKDSIEKYLEWVLLKIDQVEVYTKQMNKKDVNIQDIKEVLSQRVHVSLVLNSEYQRYKTLLTHKKRNYNVWWSEKFTEKRRELNPTTLSSGKWSSKSDIEAEAISTFKDEYLLFQSEIDDLEDRVSFLRRLMEDWNSVSFDCNGIIKILEIEAYMYSNVSGVSDQELRRRHR